MTVNHRSLVRLAALALLVAAWPARADHGDLAERLDRGEIVLRVRDVPDSPAPRVTAMAVVDAPPEAVWAIVSSCVRLQEVLGSGSVATVLPAKGRRTRCQVRVAMPFPFDDLLSITEVEQRVGKGRWRSQWTLGGGDFLANDGSWTLAHHGDGTLVVYEVHAAPNLTIPRALLVQTQRDEMSAMLERIREVLR